MNIVCRIAKCSIRKVRHSKMLQNFVLLPEVLISLALEVAVQRSGTRRVHTKYSSLQHNAAFVTGLLRVLYIVQNLSLKSGII